MPPLKGRKSTIVKRLDKVFKTAKSPASFSGPEAVYQAVNAGNAKPHIPRKRVETYLRREESYSVHKQPKRKFKRRKVVVYGMNSQWQADLVDMSKFHKENEGHKFILTVMDVLSRKAYARALKSKEGKNVTAAFESILEETKGQRPFKLQTDKGKEFYNKPFKTWCEDNGIILFSSEDDMMKAQIVERFNRTLKNKMYRMFNANADNVWIKNLDDLVQSYNNTEHSSIKMTPNQVTTDNQDAVFHTLFPVEPPQSTVKSNLKVGDYVRILNPPKVFKKGYDSQWTIEVFRVRNVHSFANFHMYELKDLKDEKVDGYFYAKELQKTVKPTVFKIDKVLKRDGNQDYVRWVGYPSKFDSHVRKSDYRKHSK